MARRWPLILLLCAAFGAPARPGAQPPDDLERAFSRLYNFDFQGAHAILNQYISKHPADPLGYAVRSAVYLYSELDRLGILESGFLSDDRKITDNRKRLKPDPAVRALFLQSVEDAESRAKSTLAGKPDDYHSMFATCLTQSLMVDYTALIEKKSLGSLPFVKRSNSCAQDMLKAHPEAYDAYVTTGFTEYLVGSLAFYVRWFVHFDEVKGSKIQGIQNLQLAARSGHYLKSFAKMLLALAYLREKQPEQCETLLAELTREYPENPLFRKELAKLSSRARMTPRGSR